MDWAPWPNQDGEMVGENELAAVENLANIAHENATAIGLMQHLDQPQDSHSVSSEARGFLRAQGDLITMELPLPTNPTANRTIAVTRHSLMHFDSDYLI